MKKIYLDPGHGYDTPGKRSPDGSLLEYEFNQVVADLAEKLLISNGFDVRVTKRMKDKDLGLTARCNLANNWKADIFMSIHANAMSNVWSDAKGWEVYSYPGKTDGAKLAKVAAQQAYPEVAKFGVKNRGCRTENFAVVRQTNMPAILFEFAFFSNREECALLKRQDFRMACAVGVAKTACAWFGVPYKGTTTTPAKPSTPEQKTYDVFDGNKKKLSSDTNKDSAYKNGWKVFNNGVNGAYLVEPTGSIYTFSKHPADNPSVTKIYIGGKYHSFYKTESDALTAGWKLYNAGSKDAYYVNEKGSQYTFDKHPEDNPNKPVSSNEPVKSSNGTLIKGSNEITDGKIIDAFIKQYNANAPAVGQHYISIGAQLGLRGDIAVCQAIKETGWFKFGGDVKVSQNNFCGLGTTGGGVAGASFPTVKDGVMAHMQHLWAYITTQPLPNGIAVIDPRFKLVQSLNKNAKSFEDLGGHWAVPGYDKKKYASFDVAFKAGQTYGQQILDIYASLKAFAAKQTPSVPKEEAPKADAEKKKEKKDVLYTFTKVENEKILSVVVDGKGFVRATDIAALFNKKALFDSQNSEIVIANLPPVNKQFEAPGKKQTVNEVVTFTVAHFDKIDIDAILINGKGFVRVTDIAKSFGYSAKYDSVAKEIVFVR